MKVKIVDDTTGELAYLIYLNSIIEEPLLKDTIQLTVWGEEDDGDLCVELADTQLIVVEQYWVNKQEFLNTVTCPASLQKYVYEYLWDCVEGLKQTVIEAILSHREY